MRYLPFILIAVVLIALDWAALARIVRGGRGAIAAWIMVAMSGLICGVMLGILLRPKEGKRRNQ